MYRWAACVFQDSLKKRMEQLKQSILEGSKAVEEEKAKNIELLHEIFPPDIATKLWRGDYNLYTTCTLYTVLPSPYYKAFICNLFCVLICFLER